MVELGGHFLLLFFFKSKHFFDVHVQSNIFGASRESSIQGIKYFNQGSICGTHTTKFLAFLPLSVNPIETLFIPG